MIPPVRFASPSASTLRWDTVPTIYGLGATAEIGQELRALDARRVAIITDENIVATGLVEEVLRHLREAAVEAVVWSGGQMEPTEASALRGVDDLGSERFDAYIGLGGGSCIDTCKVINLLTHHPAELVAYVAAPHGEGRKVPKALAPMVGVPTTSGPGAESAGAAALVIAALGEKASLVDRALRPSLAIIDPLNTLAAPPAVIASAGYDAVIQSLESYTSRPFDHVPAAPTRARSALIGANPISDIWCERALELCGRYLVRAVYGGHDIDAHVGMAQASMFSRLGTAGAHLPHANSAAVASLARGYTPTGFTGLDRQVVPHGHAVASTAAESFAFTYAGAPERHRRAAELLGIDPEEVRDDGARALARWIRRLIEITDGPTHLGVFGFASADVPSLVEKAAGQRRLLPRSPRPVNREALSEIFTRSLQSRDDG